MSWIRVRQMSKSSIRELARFRPEIDLEPVYQRQSGLWNLEKRQLLVDSILNGLDVPKLYFHEQPKKTPRFAVIDGKQRLEALWGFMDGGFSLADDFELFEKEDVRLEGKNYVEFGRAHPALLQQFEATELTVMLVQTDDIEMVEEMFSRLNEAVPLNAPEKRNAMGGPLPAAVRELARHPFFTECLWLENARYRHLDLATKFLLIEHRDRVTSTKKRELDDLFANFKEHDDKKGAAKLKQRVETNLDKLAEVFDKPDRLLSSVGMIVVYYLFFRSTSEKCDRQRLVEFDELRERNRAIDREVQRKLQLGEDVGKLKGKLDPKFVKFETYSTSLNDPTALDFRVSALQDHLHSGMGLKAR